MVRTADAVGINSEAGLPVRWGGHAEGLRRRRGDAVGVKAGASLIDRFRGERGNHPRSPSRRAAGPVVGGSVVDRWPGAGRRPRSSPSTREACTWRRGPASRQGGCWDARRLSPVNTDESELALLHAERRVREIQAKLHRWARDDPHRWFDDLFNLVADPAFLLVAWDRVRGNKGARTAGVDGWTAASIVASKGVEVLLDEVRSQLKDRSFRPLPVR